MNSDFALSQTDGRPMYLQIIEQIKLRVAAGDWPAGHKLPSIRRLSVSLRVSAITVKRAYLELEREGVIITRHGKGSWIAPGVELDGDLHRTELDDLLQKVARLALLMGLDRRQVEERLGEALVRLDKENNP